MRKNQIPLTLGLLFLAAMLGWYFRGMSENNAGGKNGVPAESIRDLNSTADRGPHSAAEFARPGSGRESATDIPAGVDSLGQAIGPGTGYPQMSSPPPIIAMPPGVQPSEVQVSQDGTTMHFSKMPPSTEGSSSTRPRSLPNLQVVDVRVSPDGNTNYIVRLPSASGQSQSTPLIMLPPNVRPDEVEISPEGVISSIRRVRDAEGSVQPEKVTPPTKKESGG